MTQNKHSTQTGNRLAAETSPYLLQHADNPVHWHAWGPEALELARSQDKPILLSVGYSACHWCHVMAHESFEDPATARVMNELFVNIKVDREERPDLDKIYQTAHALLTQRNGGWPLTMFLTPQDRIPFFGGTYFPNHARHGLPAFTDLLQRVDEFYRQNRVDIDRQNASLVDALQAMTGASQGEPGQLDPLPLDLARQQLVQSFDDRHGGFGGAPKFPHPTSIDRLLRHWAAASSDNQARDVALFTLRKMALGGINDQLAGGFCRYSVDDLWMIPHFEKMLYDNGPLLALYSQAWQITADPLFERVTRETAAWAMQEMQSPAGGYYSSLDADSEGEEGKYYVWTRDQVREILSEAEYQVFAARFGLDRKANFEGHWHLHIYREYDELEQLTGVDSDHARVLVDSARAKLAGVRQQRVPPGRDDKILTSWNGLMIRGMAIASRHLDEPAWEQSARRALDFIRNTLWRDGRLLATCKDEHAHLDAYLDDYVFLIDAILELLQTRWRDGDLEFAIELAEVVLQHFADETGGFFFTADDHESLIQRPKPLSDDATPSGNGVAAFVLGRLGHLLGESRYLDAAERTLKTAWQGIEQAPHAHTSLLLALEEHLFPPEVVVIRGTTEDARGWLEHIHRSWQPRRLAFAIPDSTTNLPGILQERQTAGGGVTAWVCQDLSCQPPVTTLDELDKLLLKG